MNVRQIIKEEYAKVLLQQFLLENETPDHFGGGENIEVYGYQTEHFDICKSAVILFNKLKEKDLDNEVTSHAAKSAEYIDKLFGIEKVVVDRGSTESEEIEEAADLLALFAYELGCVGRDHDLTRDIAFAKLHLMDIANRYKGSLANEAKLEKEKFTDPDDMRMHEGVAFKKILKAIPDSYGYKDLADDIANIIKDEYGSHNIKPFLKALMQGLKQ